MRRRPALFLLIIVALQVAACGSGDAPIAVGDLEAPNTPAPTTPPPTKPASVTTDQGVEATMTALRPDQPLHDGCVEPPTDALETLADGRLSVRPQTVVAGSSLTVSWEVDPAETFTTGNELVVSCWNGVDWMPVWFAFSVFAHPNTVVLTAETIERYLFTADAWGETEGVVNIPPDAPAGTYLLTERLYVFRPGDVADPGRGSDGAYVVVRPPDPGPAES